jgi:carboxyl-terminal processing protease
VVRRRNWRPGQSSMRTLSPHRLGAAAFAVGILAAARGLSAGPEVNVIRTATAEIDARYLYADSPAWARERSTLLAAVPGDAARQHALLRAALAELGDPELHLLSPVQFAALQSETAGKRLGTGLIDFGIDRAPTGEARVVATLDNSPARRAGLLTGDVLTSIDHVPTRGIDHETIVDRLRVSRPVTLSVRRGGQILRLTITPTEEPLRAVVCEARGASGAPVGYVRVAQFTPDAAAQTRIGLLGLQDRQPVGYILDLRDNPGGLLDVAAEIAGLFRTGIFGAKVRSNGASETIFATASPIVAGPLVVLINEGAASAAEFTAGALQGLPRVRLVGRPTRGRGQAQTYVALDHGWGVIVPSARLRTRQGVDLKEYRLQPDILVAGPTSSEASMSDLVYARALSVLAELSEETAPRLKN